MIVLTCIIWIEGNSFDGGESICGIHEAEIQYSSMYACRYNINAYEKYVEESIFDAFEMPSDYTIKTTCYKDFGRN